MNKNEVQDLFDYWHLTYEGKLSLGEFMQANAGWSDMDLAEYEVTGTLPHG